MRLITDIPDLQTDALPPSVATIGFFDGVHRGHRFLISQVSHIARERSLATLLVTFTQHPRMVMQADYQPRLLSSFDEKCTLLSHTGIDTCVALSFTPGLAALSARDFMRKILHERLQVRVLVIGYDHRFGHNRAEGFDDYVRYATDLGMEVVRAEACQLNGIHVSSSVIRSFLEAGEVGLAARCLGYCYTLSGHVISGRQIGRTLGFPTANLQTDDPLKLLPADGVYAVRVLLGKDIYKGMLNIGFRPTIDDDIHRTIEVHLLHFEGNLYGRSLHIRFVRRIRGERKFHSLEALALQLQLDAAACEESH